MPASPLAVAAGLALVFFLPGFGVVRALFPERRILRPLSLRTLVEEVTAGVVLSVVLTILVGFVWLGSQPGLQAAWSDPLVEATLAGIAGAAFALAVWRGSFRRVAPPGPLLEPEAGLEDPLELIRRLDALAREERRLVHRLRGLGEGSIDGDRIRQDLSRVRAEVARVKREREVEYAS